MNAKSTSKKRRRSMKLAATMVAAGALAAPAIAIGAPGVSLTRTPAPPSAASVGNPIELDFTVSFDTVPFSLVFRVADLQGNVIFEEPVPITGAVTQDRRSYTPAPGTPPGRYTARYVFQEQQGFEAEAAVIFDYATALANGLTEVVFHDRNGNGVKDSGEEGIQNWLIRLTNPIGNAVQVLTNAQGERTDSNVPAGVWNIATATTPESRGYRPTTPISSNVNVPQSGSARWELGLAAPVTVTGTVFIDANRNGSLDPGELPYTGAAPIALTGTTGTGTTVSETQNSDQTAGTFRFGNLLPGTYGVGVTVPTGFFPTTPTQRGGLTVSSGGESANNNFGLIQAGNLRLGAFHDRNMNGVKEAGEEGVSGWTFSRTAPAGGVATSDTEADGTITHQNLQPGSWQVSGETPVPSEWISTTSTSGTVPVPSGGTGEFQLGLVKPTLICGTVFLDDNQNGTLDAGERIKPNSAVTLSGSDLSGKTHSITGLSDGAGEYCFSVPPGTYSVTITTPDGFTLTTPPAYTGIGTGSGQTSSGNDFGLFSPSPRGTLLINVFHDRNMNGTQQGNEEGVSSWSFTRSGPPESGTSVANTLNTSTGPNGTVSHQDVLAGPWVVVSREQPAASGWIGTTPTSGAVNVPALGVGRFDMGVVRPVQVCGTVFIDTDKDGKLDPGEPKRSDVRLDLTGRDLGGGNVSQTLNSGADGTYCFTVPPGDYEVRVSRPGGFTLTTVQVRAGISPAAGGTSNGNDFGLAAPPPALSPEGPATLSINKTGPANVRRGRAFTFKIVVKNTSKNTARNVVLIDPIPDTVTLVARPVGAAVVNGVITWKLGTIAAGKSKTRSFRARVSPGVTVSRVRNAATASADGVPPRTDTHQVRLTDPPPPPRTGGVTG